MSAGALIALLLVVCAFTLWRPLGRVRAALGISHLVATGHAFLILGYLAGIALPDQAATQIALDLEPVAAFVAGWVGFAVGMRFDRRVLSQVPFRAFGVGLAPGIGAALAAGGTAFAGLLAFGGGVYESSAAALIVAAAAVSSGPAMAFVLRRRRAGRAVRARAILRMIEFSAGIDDALVVALAVVAFAFFRVDAGPLAAPLLVALAFGVGAGLAVVTYLFLGGRSVDDERLLLGLAMLALTAGFASWFRLSPASVAAITAFVLVNLPGERRLLLLAAVRKVERPAVVILMAVIGFEVAQVATWLVVPIALALTVCRLAGKYLLGALVARDFPGQLDLAAPRNWALGLVAQGNLGLMITLSFFHVWRSEMALAVLAAVALSSILNELFAPVLIARVLKQVSARAHEEAA